MSHLTFPNEGAQYRKARNTLLAEEIALRQHIEAVAVQRRALPPGGEVPEDSTAGNSYDADYFGDSSKVPAALRKIRGGRADEVWDETMFNVFRLDNGTVRHFWGSELTWTASESGRDHRSGDAVSALWGLLDMTPEGRGQFLAKLAY